eukprot:495202-Pleurochrysis_carterae.AAC.1
MEPDTPTGGAGRDTFDGGLLKIQINPGYRRDTNERSDARGTQQEKVGLDTTDTQAVGSSRT